MSMLFRVVSAVMMMTCYRCTVDSVSDRVPLLGLCIMQFDVCI